MEKTLGMPYEKLFDPKHESPLYAGLKLDSKTKTLKQKEGANNEH